MELIRVKEKIEDLSIHKGNGELTPIGEQMLKELEYLVKLASNTEIIGNVSSKDLFDMGLKYVLKIAEDEGRENLHLDTAEMVAKDYMKHVKHFLSCC